MKKLRTPHSALRTRIIPQFARGVVVLSIIAYLGSGVYVIRPNEVGIVRRLGRVASMTVEGESVPKIFPPGLHYRLPYPITRLDKVRPTETRTVTVGFEPADELLGRETDPRAAEVLTGDQNIMRLRMTIQYTIGDPIAFLFGSTDPVAILRQEAEGCLTRAVASVDVDSLIGADRVGIGARVREELDREMALHQPGVKVTAVSLQAPTPPREVADAFNEVQSAKAEKQALINKADGDRKEMVTKAEGEAGKLRTDAEIYTKDRVEEARGEAERFEKLVEKYRQAKEVTALRLYIEAMEDILPKMKKIFVDADKDGGPIDLGIVETKP